MCGFEIAGWRRGRFWILWAVFVSEDLTEREEKYVLGGRRGSFAFGREASGAVVVGGGSLAILWIFVRFLEGGGVELRLEMKLENKLHTARQNSSITKLKLQALPRYPTLSNDINNHQHDYSRISMSPALRASERRRCVNREHKIPELQAKADIIPQARELSWLLDSLQETLVSLKSGLEECYALLAPIEPGSTLVMSSSRSESVKGHVTRVGTQIVKGVVLPLFNQLYIHRY